LGGSAAGPQGGLRCRNRNPAARGQRHEFYALRGALLFQSPRGSSRGKKLESFATKRIGEPQRDSPSPNSPGVAVGRCWRFAEDERQGLYDYTNQGHFVRVITNGNRHPRDWQNRGRALAAKAGDGGGRGPVSRLPRSDSNRIIEVNSEDSRRKFINGSPAPGAKGSWGRPASTLGDSRGARVFHHRREGCRGAASISPVSFHRRPARAHRHHRGGRGGMLNALRHQPGRDVQGPRGWCAWKPALPRIAWPWNPERGRLSRPEKT